MFYWEGLLNYGVRETWAPVPRLVAHSQNKLFTVSETWDPQSQNDGRE